MIFKKIWISIQKNRDNQNIQIKMLQEKQIGMKMISSRDPSSHSLQKILVEKRFKCTFDKDAIDICLNKRCLQNNIFICLDRLCQCQPFHMRCMKGNLKTLTEIVESKLIDIQPLKQHISQMIDKSIDELSQLQQVLLKEVEYEFKYSQFNMEEKMFFQLLKGEDQKQKFTSQNALKIWQSENVDKSKSIAMINSLNNQLKALNQRITTSITSLTTKIIPANQKAFFQKSSFVNQIIKNSAICQTEDLSIILLKMFSKKIKNMQYLFRASKNQFSIQKFFQSCGHLPNTLIICKTNRDKIIGAFTPLVHDHQNKDNFVPDPHNDSFIFSLTDNCIFTLVNHDKAICRQKAKSYINFGGGQFVICNNANQTKQCVSFVNKANYFCPSYSKNDKAAYLRFNGNQTAQFTTKQWEVWAVQFQGK